MKSKHSRWTKVMSIGTVVATLLSAGLTSAANIPVTSCPNGFRTIRLSGSTAPGICISNTPHGASRFTIAAFLCHVAGAHVASVDDLFFVYNTTSLESTYNPKDKWLGPGLAFDDTALCGNVNVTSGTDPDLENFEGHCHKNDQRQYWCAMDLK